MAFTLSTSTPTGSRFSIGIDGAAPPKPVAGEPGAFPTRTMLIVGGLAAVAVVLIMFVK